MGKKFNLVFVQCFQMVLKFVKSLLKVLKGVNGRVVQLKMIKSVLEVGDYFLGLECVFL